MRKIILKHANLDSLSIPSVAAKVDSLVRSEATCTPKSLMKMYYDSTENRMSFPNTPTLAGGGSGLFPAQTGSNRALDRAQVKLEVYACSIIRAHWYV